VPELRDWGLLAYESALSQMRELRAERRRGGIPDTLILVEHPGVITVGVQGDDGETPPPGIPVIHVERGGKSTYHGPGQLVGYPIIDLDPRGHDVRRFVHDVEETVVQALVELGVTGTRISGRRGVWVEGGRKIASVGVAVEEWVTFHGFALNVNNDLAPFAGIHPCGMDGRMMTSVSLELGRPTRVETAKGPIVRAFGRLFGPVVDHGHALSQTSEPASFAVAR
jgi:lipoate-protein ligase B